MKFKFHTFFRNLDLIMMSVFLVVIFLALFAQVMMRWVFGTPLIWSEEVARYSYVWITMIALGYNQRTGNNISMSLVADTFPRPVRLAVGVLSDLAVIAVCCLPMPSIIQYLQLNRHMRSNTLGYSLGLVAVSIPLGFVYMILMQILHCVQLVMRYRKGENMF